MLAGTNAAFAWDQRARVHAGGEYFHDDPANVLGSFSDRIHFGFEGKCPTANTTCSSNGEFEYENHFSGVHAHGKFTTLSINSQPSGTCLMIMASLGLDMTGKPSAVADGTCRDGSCTSFHMEVIDGDDNAPNNGDWVCSVSVNGRNKMKQYQMEGDSAQQLNHGDVEVRTTSEH